MAEARHHKIFQVDKYASSFLLMILPGMILSSLSYTTILVPTPLIRLAPNVMAVCQATYGSTLPRPTFPSVFYLLVFSLKLDINYKLQGFIIFSLFISSPPLARNFLLAIRKIPIIFEVAKSIVWNLVLKNLHLFQNRLFEYLIEGCSLSSNTYACDLSTSSVIRYQLLACALFEAFPDLFYEVVQKFLSKDLLYFCLF